MLLQNIALYCLDAKPITIPVVWTSKSLLLVLLLISFSGIKDKHESVVWGLDTYSTHYNRQEQCDCLGGNNNVPLQLLGNQAVK